MSPETEIMKGKINTVKKKDIMKVTTGEMKARVNTKTNIAKNTVGDIYL